MRASDLGKGLLPVAAAAAVLFAPIEVDTHARSALAIAVAMILAWITEALHPAIVGFMGSFLFCATGDVEFETAFAGFSTVTPWFLYGVIMLLNAAQTGGLTARLGARSPQALTRSPVAAGLTLIALAYALPFAVPAVLARAAILVLLASAWSIEDEATKPVLVLIAAYGAAAFGHAEMPGGPLAIGGWDLGVAVALGAGVVVLSRGTIERSKAAATPTSARTLDRRVAALVAVVIGMWVTASFHHAPPELVGVIAGLVCALPWIAGATDRHSRPTADPLAIILAGTAISIPAVLLETKAAAALTHYWTVATASGVMPQDLVAYWASTAYRMFSPDGARLALPVLDGVAGHAGAAASWAYAGSTLFSLHQSPALVLAMSIGGVRARQVWPIGLLILLIGSIVVLAF